LVEKTSLTTSDAPSSSCHWYQFRRCHPKPTSVDTQDLQKQKLEVCCHIPSKKGPGSFAKIRVGNADYYVEDGILVTRNVKKYQQRPAYRYNARPHVELGSLISYDIAREMKLDGVWKEVVEASAATPRLAICNHEKC
jgi:hypothetical protein